MWDADPTVAGRTGDGVPGEVSGVAASAQPRR